MTLDLTAARPDITYLRRRPRLDDKPKPIAVVAQNFLSITGPEEGRPVTAVIPDKPPVLGRTVLTATEPVARLNARQSAIGSLTVTGATEFAWETAKNSGIVRAYSADPLVPVFANRPLVEWVNGSAVVVVGLRHSAALRRLIFGANSGKITVALGSGASIIVDTRDGLDVLHLSVVGRVIEARLETLDQDEDIAGTFSIGR